MTPFIQRFARDDMLRQYRYFLDQAGLADCFFAAVNDTINPRPRRGLTCRPDCLPSPIPSPIAGALEMGRLAPFGRRLIAALFFAFLPGSLAGAATPPPGTLPMYCQNGGEALYTPAHLDIIRTNLSRKFCLGKDIDLIGRNWAPIGGESNSFSGALSGKSCSALSRPETCKTHTISNLTITASSSSSAYVIYGLFCCILNAKIENIGLLNVKIAVTYTGANAALVGGLVGWPFSGPAISNVISNSYVTGSINVQTTRGLVGGLTGGAGSTMLIQRSFSTATVVASNSVVGGLVGWSCCGSLSQIKQSYTTGPVIGKSGSWAVGGLVGENDGNIEQSYATGPVTVQHVAGGGLVGYNYRNGLISQSYATGSVTGASSSTIGGLVGVGGWGSISQSYATGATTGGGGGFVGGLVGAIGGLSPQTFTINQSYATGQVAAGSGGTKGGLVARRDIGGSVTNSYWDVDSTGQATSPGGGIAKHTSELKTALQPGFNSAVWGVYPVGVVGSYPPVGAIYPYLKWQSFLDGFPLRNCAPAPNCTPFTVPIISVVDHSGTPLDPNPIPGNPDPTKRRPWYFKDSTVKAYNGETGKKMYGENCPPVGYKKDNAGTPFILNGRYIGAACEGLSNQRAYLNYDGHPGFDYSAASGTPIYAPMDGILKKAAIDNVNRDSSCDTLSGWAKWHSFYIDHGNGFLSWYLHADRLVANIEALIGADLTKTVPVKKGDVVAFSGKFGPCGNRIGMPAHLHFEVRKGPVELQGAGVQDQIVDPYSEAVWIPGFLASPLSYGVYTAGKITSVLDHSLKQNSPGGFWQYGTISSSGGNGVIIAFNNEKANGTPKPSDQTCIGGTILLNGMTNTGGCGAGYASYDEHPGYDYRAALDTPIKAAAAGKVVNNGGQRCVLTNIPGACNDWGYVGIDHGNGYITQYGHLQVGTISVTAGQVVTQGQQIGLSGHTARPPATVGDHLHFEVIKLIPGRANNYSGLNYAVVDPYGWFGPGADPLYSVGLGIPSVKLWQ